MEWCSWPWMWSEWKKSVRFTGLTPGHWYVSVVLAEIGTEAEGGRRMSAGPRRPVAVGVPGMVATTTGTQAGHAAHAPPAPDRPAMPSTRRPRSSRECRPLSSERCRRQLKIIVPCTSVRSPGFRCILGISVRVICSALQAAWWY